MFCENMFTGSYKTFNMVNKIMNSYTVICDRFYVAKNKFSVINVL